MSQSRASSTSSKSTRFVPYKDNHASKLRYELKRNQSEDKARRSRSYSPSKYSARLCQLQSDVDVQKGSTSRPNSYVRLKYLPKSTTSTSCRALVVSTEKNQGLISETVENKRHFSNTSLAKFHIIYQKKETICRNANVPSYFTKKYGNRHSFKSQLEDIKSSFLILNEKNK